MKRHVSLAKSVNISPAASHCAHREAHSPILNTKTMIIPRPPFTDSHRFVSPSSSLLLRRPGQKPDAPNPDPNPSVGGCTNYDNLRNPNPYASLMLVIEFGFCEKLNCEGRCPPHTT